MEYGISQGVLGCFKFALTFLRKTKQRTNKTSKQKEQ
jgi:hypothetical protein